MNLTRRALLVGSLMLLAGPLPRVRAAAAKPSVLVYKTPT